jgi:hypothetical protein
MGLVQKVFIVMLSMNLFLYFYIPTDWGVDSNSVLDNFIDLEGEQASMSGTSISENVPSSTSSTTASIGTGTLTFVSTFGMVWNFIKFVLTLLFAPILIIYIVPDIPLAVAAFFILPNVLILIFGTISFIKGSDW